MTRLLRAVDALAFAAGRLLGWGYVLIALVMGWEVAARYALGAPTIWAHEVSGLLAAAAFIFGGAWCMAEDSHMRITLLSERFRGRGAKAAEALSLAVGFVYLLGMSVATWAMTERSLLRVTANGWSPERSGTSWNTPAPAFLKLALLLGSILFLLVILRRAVALVRGDDG